MIPPGGMCGIGSLVVAVTARHLYKKHAWSMKLAIIVIGWIGKGLGPAQPWSARKIYLGISFINIFYY